MTNKSTFWSTCPRKLDYFPEASCFLGKASSQNKTEDCAWHINSEQDHYCFWTWTRRVSNKDGFFEPLLQHEMSDLLGISSTKIHAIFKETVEKIKHSEDLAPLLKALQD